MKPNKQWTQKFILASVAIVGGIAFAQATPDEAPCAVVMKTGKGVQVIPAHGNVLNHLVDAAPLSCNSMVITHEDPFWIKLSDQTVVKIAPQSFIELSKSESHVFHLYRGQALIASAPGISNQTWSTPNSEMIFKGGVAYLNYQPNDRVTRVSCFNREFQFRNKFNTEAAITVHAGEMSHLAIQEASVKPVQPAIMNQASVNQVLASLKLDEEDQKELADVVKRVYDGRSKTLTTELAEWETDAKEKGERGPASDPAPVIKGIAAPVHALDRKEADFVSREIHDHLYGSAEDQKLVEPARKPASVTSDILMDTEKEKNIKGLKQETKRLEKEIERINENE